MDDTFSNAVEFVACEDIDLADKLLWLEGQFNRLMHLRCEFESDLLNQQSKSVPGCKARNKRPVGNSL